MKVPENVSYHDYIRNNQISGIPDSLIYNRNLILKSVPAQGDQFDCSAHRINLQRGRDKKDPSQANYLSDIDMQDPNRVTVHLNIVEYSVDEKSFGKYGDNEQGRRLYKLFYQGTTAVMHVKLPGISKWTAFKQ